MKDGYFYIFTNDIYKIKQLPISKHKLTRNFRNIEAINNWIKDLYPENTLMSEIKGGLAVRHFVWNTYEDEKLAFEKYR